MILAVFSVLNVLLFANLLFTLQITNKQEEIYSYSLKKNLTEGYVYAKYTENDANDENFYLLITDNNEYYNEIKVNKIVYAEKGRGEFFSKDGRAENTYLKERRLTHRVKTVLDDKSENSTIDTALYYTLFMKH